MNEDSSGFVVYRCPFLPLSRHPAAVHSKPVSLGQRGRLLERAVRAGGVGGAGSPGAPLRWARQVSARDVLRGGKLLQPARTARQSRALLPAGAQAEAELLTGLDTSRCVMTLSADCALVDVSWTLFPHQQSQT